MLYCKSASLAEVESNGFVLSPGRYVGSEAEEEDGVPFEEKLKALTEELAKQFEDGTLLEKRIWENLGGIGFGLYLIEYRIREISGAYAYES
ncbi:SAM-dependent methyltransferase [Cesiribacter sp. SM1]|uniref:SAM-dependent methyltransferase n=1 Tax=Cesiribacter sp. SM1 TaxID=2861196 RepID=UPI001CD1DB4B|nr:SAM-dependent methyltransferase [Cesiribacter sp. SM1]